MSAVLALLRAGGFSSQFAPSHWLLAPFLPPGSLLGVPPVLVLLAQIGVDLWLPASLLLLLFWCLGLHRRRAAPRHAWASRLLALAWLSSIAAYVLRVLLAAAGEGAVVVIILLGMAWPFLFVLPAAGLVGGAIELSTLLKHRGLPSAPPLLPLLAWAVLPPLMAVIPLLLAPSNPLGVAAAETTRFDALCRQAGVQLLQSPAGPVRSIAYDWDPQKLRGRPWADRFVLDERGRIVPSINFALPEPEKQKVHAFDFTESRPDPGRFGRSLRNPDAPWYRFPAQGPYFGVDGPTADLLAFVEVDKPAEMQKGTEHQGPVLYKLTLSDRRSGAVLGVMAYAVDRVNKRACGANFGRVISQAAFIHDAIHR